MMPVGSKNVLVIGYNVVMGSRINYIVKIVHSNLMFPSPYNFLI